MNGLLVFTFIISIGAGFVDAIAGGGGLILLPSLLFCGLSPGAAIATNKLFNVASSSTSALRFWRSGTIRWDLFGRMIAPALVGALTGSQLIGRLPRSAAEPVVAGLLLLVALVVLFKPDFGQAQGESSRSQVIPWSARRTAWLGAAGFLIGIHDGFFGPGAGIFLIFALIHLGKSSFLGATSTAKVVNVLTSSCALVAFVRAGQVNWVYGVVGSIGVMIGSHFGARSAGFRGASLIRPMFVCMAIAISLRLVV